mmetsp:Transcript_30864/g.72453  ORF Transcript_30864/g.72453 Transcript_30864/m.72453 type:complete len:259 (-) Transcript_30864:587-1363(-)
MNHGTTTMAQDLSATAAASGHHPLASRKRALKEEVAIGVSSCEEEDPMVDNTVSNANDDPNRIRDLLLEGGESSSPEQVDSEPVEATSTVRTPRRIRQRHQRQEEEDPDTTPFLLLTPAQVGFPKQPTVSTRRTTEEFSSTNTVEYVGRVRSLLAPPPPPPMALEEQEDDDDDCWLFHHPTASHHPNDDDDQDDDLELACLYRATRRPLPSIPLRPRPVSQDSDFWHDHRRAQEARHLEAVTAGTHEPEEEAWRLFSF